MSGLLDRLVDWESDVRYQETALDTASRIGRIAGPVPVLLSAPHAVVHTRRGESKEEEEFTAALVCEVANLTGANALYVRRRTATDPNWDRGVPYKRRLAAIVDRTQVRFVFDVHGTAPDRSFGIALGTMEGESCPDQRPQILLGLEDSGFRPDAPFPDRLDVDQTFTAVGIGEQETITAFVSQRLGVPSAQLELHPLLRVVERREDASLPVPFHGDPGRIERVVKALVDLVQSFGAAVPGDLTAGGKGSDWSSNAGTAGGSGVSTQLGVDRA